MPSAPSSGNVTSGMSQSRYKRMVSQRCPSCQTTMMIPVPTVPRMLSSVKKTSRPPVWHQAQSNPSKCGWPKCSKQQQESSLSQGFCIMAMYPPPKFARRNCRSRAGDSEKAVWLTLATPGRSSSAKLEKIKPPSNPGSNAVWTLACKMVARERATQKCIFLGGLQATQSSAPCLSRFRDFCVQKISCKSIGELKASVSTSTHLWPCKLSYMTGCLRGSEKRPPSSTERKPHIGRWHYCSARGAKGMAFEYCPRPSRWTVKLVSRSVRLLSWWKVINLSAGLLNTNFEIFHRKIGDGHQMKVIEVSENCEVVEHQ